MLVTNNDMRATKKITLQSVLDDSIKLLPSLIEDLAQNNPEKAAGLILQLAKILTPPPKSEDSTNNTNNKITISYQQDLFSNAQSKP